MAYDNDTPMAKRKRKGQPGTQPPVPGAREVDRNPQARRLGPSLLQRAMQAPAQRPIPGAVGGPRPGLGTVQNKLPIAPTLGNRGPAPGQFTGQPEVARKKKKTLNPIRPLY